MVGHIDARGDEHAHAVRRVLAVALEQPGDVELVHRVLEPAVAQGLPNADEPLGVVDPEPQGDPEHRIHVGVDRRHGVAGPC
jgi:hypothetical protein